MDGAQPPTTGLQGVAATAAGAAAAGAYRACEGCRPWRGATGPRVGSPSPDHEAIRDSTTAFLSIHSCRFSSDWSDMNSSMASSSAWSAATMSRVISGNLEQVGLSGRHLGNPVGGFYAGRNFHGPQVVTFRQRR